MSNTSILILVLFVVAMLFIPSFSAAIIAAFNWVVNCIVVVYLGCILLAAIGLLYKWMTNGLDGVLFKYDADEKTYNF